MFLFATKVLETKCDSKLSSLFDSLSSEWYVRS